MQALDLVANIHLFCSPHAPCLQDITSLEAKARLNLDERLAEENVAGELSLMKGIDAKIIWHVAPIIMLAHSRTNLPAKTRVFLHTLGLLSGSQTALLELCKSVVSIHTDYGTEKGIARVTETPLEVILPYLHSQKEKNHAMDMDIFIQDLPSEDTEVFSGELEPPTEPEPMVSFNSSLEGPDMMHIIHNATNDLEDVLVSYGPMLSSLKSLCSLLSGRETKQQLIETCFNSGPAIAFQDMIQSFQINVHEARWNTIAAAIEEVNSLEPALKSYWNLAQFLGGPVGVCKDESVPAEKPADQPNCEAFGVGLRSVDEAICSDKFWGSIKIMLPIAKIQREAVRWANGCPCHSDLEKELRLPDTPIEASKVLKQLVEGCPLRGRRCAELAAGDFFQVLRHLFEESATRLEFQLSRGLSKEDATELMKDFHLARQHLLMTYVVKLSFWTQAPHVLAGLAHWDPQTRIRCLQKCLQSKSSHPKISQLRTELMPAIQEFMECGGAWLNSVALEPLCLLAAELRLMFTSAWRVEGQHARTKKAAQHAPRHSAAYTSLAHRLPEIKECIQRQPDVVSCLADLMAVVSNGRSAAKRLGFSEELLLHCGWISPRTFDKKKVGFSVIYHDDPYCKYTLSLPEQIGQRPIVRRTIPASTGDPAEAAELQLQEGSVLLRRALALQDVRKGLSRNDFLTMKLNMASLSTLEALLSPPQDQTSSSIEGFLSGESADTSSHQGKRPELGLGLAKKLDSSVGLLELAGSENQFVVASVLHDQPSRFHRTHVEEEACLSGVLLIQLHSIIKTNAAKGSMDVSLDAIDFSRGEGPGQFFEPSVLTLHCNQLPLTELCELKVWQVDDGAMSYALSPDILELAPAGLGQNFSEVVQLLLKSPDGFSVTPSLSRESVDALDIMAAQDLVFGPPWKLTERGHAHLRQCISLHSGEHILKRNSGPIQDLSMYQLVLALDDMGWSQEVVSTDKHKHLKKSKYTHTKDGYLIWFTQEGKVTVSYYYLLALAHLSLSGGSSDREGLSVDVQAVPYGATDTFYKKLLGLEAGAPVGGRRQYTRKLKFGHVADDVWPDDQKQQRKRKKPIKKKPVAKAAKTLLAAHEEHGEISQEEAEACSEFEHVSLSSLSSISDNDAGGVDSAPPDAPVASAPEENVDPEGSKPDSSSSDSDSESSDSETSTTSSTTSESGSNEGEKGESSEAPVPPLPPPPDPPVAHTKRRDRSFAWGDHLITPVGPDDDNPLHYQIKCNRPAHNIERSCTKKRSLKFGGAETVLLCLKYWASLGCDCPTQAEHLRAWDDIVLPAWRANALPSEDELCFSTD